MYNISIPFKGHTTSQYTTCTVIRVQFYKNSHLTNI